MHGEPSPTASIPSTMPPVKSPRSNLSAKARAIRCQNSGPTFWWMPRSPHTTNLWRAGTTKNNTGLRSLVAVISSRSNALSAAFQTSPRNGGQGNADLAPTSASPPLNRLFDPILVDSYHDPLAPPPPDRPPPPLNPPPPQSNPPPPHPNPPLPPRALPRPPDKMLVRK